MLEPSEQEARGLGLLSAKHRRLHPRAQVKTLRRIAVRALSDACWAEGTPSQWHRDPPRPVEPLTPAERERIANQRQKAMDALDAAVYLNRVHSLGFPEVP